MRILLLQFRPDPIMAEHELELVVRFSNRPATDFSVVDATRNELSVDLLGGADHARAAEKRRGADDTGGGGKQSTARCAHGGILLLGKAPDCAEVRGKCSGALGSGSLD